MYTDYAKKLDLRYSLNKVTNTADKVLSFSSVRSNNQLTMLHQVFVLLQMTLGGVEFDRLTTANSEAPSPRLQSALVFKEVPRLAKCLLEIALERKDAGSVRAALDCLRSLSAKAWYDSPWVLRQLPKIGDKAVSQSSPKLRL